MRRLITIIIALCVLGIAVLGFQSMAHQGGHASSPCIGFVAGAGCPATISSLSDIAGHIAAVQNFSLGIISSSLLLGALLAVVLWFIRQQGTFDTEHPPAPAYQSHRHVRPDLSSFMRLNSWLAHHEARDPHASSWVHEPFRSS